MKRRKHFLTMASNSKSKTPTLFADNDGIARPIKKVTKAVIPAAGYGTRFLPATKAIPKEMLPIVDIPAIQYVVEECVASGITDILIITTRGKSSIENHFDKSVELENQLKKAKKTEFLKKVQRISKLANIQYVRQKEMLGSGWAIHYAKSFVENDPFLVLFPDDIMYNSGDQKPVAGQLIEAYQKTGKSILGVGRIEGEEIRKYGVVVPGRSEGKYTEVKGIIEKPQAPEPIPSQLTSLGRYLLTPDIMKILEKTPKSASGEIYLTDALTTQSKTNGVIAYEFDAKRYDTGDKFGFITAQIEYALRNEELKDKVSNYLKNLDLSKF